MDQLRKGSRPGRCTAQRMPDECREMIAVEGPQLDPSDFGCRVADCCEFSHQRMGRVDFVIAIGPDHQQVMQVGSDEQRFQQVERRGIGPLQIIEKEHERMLRAGEYPDEPPQGNLKQSMGLPWRNLRSRRLRADHELELGYELDHCAPAQPNRLAQRAAPALQLEVSPASFEAQTERSEGPSNGSVGNITLVRVELACSKQAARRHNCLVKLMDEGGFANSGITAHQQKFRSSTPGNA